jgi:hypothetical protein
MSKKVILIVLIVIGVVVMVLRGGVSFSKLDKPQTPLSTFNPQNFTYQIEGKSVTLVDGVNEEESAPESASSTITEYFGNEATGDLDGDGRVDRALLITQSTGGTGVFFYLVVLKATDAGYRSLEAFFLGDRIAPQNTRIADGIVSVNFATRATGEPMTAQPSIGVTKTFKLSGAGLLEEVK